jgi:cell wall-associated NlpC family hydrolase
MWLTTLFFYLSLSLNVEASTCFEKLEESYLTIDSSYRDSLPETLMPLYDWKPEWGKWGPWPRSFPKPQIPEHVDQKSWMRKRVSLVAKKYIGLAYKHRHIPMLGGLDCSNFTSWVYNYGLGIQFPSDIEKQSLQAGRLLSPNENLKIGDLIFIWNKNYTRISHVVLFLGNDLVIDSAKGGVQIRDWTGWRKDRTAWIRRVIN